MNKDQPVLLVVDDRPDNLFIIEQLVEEYIPSCKVLTAANAETAVQIIKEHLPDGILSDIQMPGTNGIELCRLLKADSDTSQIPVVLMTAHQSDPKLRVQGMEAGADDFIAKPIDNTELAARIKVMFRIKRGQDELSNAKLDLEKKVAQRTKELSVLNMSLTEKIKEQKQAADKLKENEEKFRRLLESTGSVPWELDLPSQEFSFMGQQIENILGYPVDTWVDKGIWVNRLHEEDRQEAVSFGQVETRAGRDHDFSYRAIHADGSIKWIQDIVSVSQGKYGPEKLVGFMHDITEKKLAEEKQANLEKRLQQAQKMEAIGTLAGGIAHDFNNILGAILGYAEMAKDDCQPGATVASDLNKVLEAGNRAKDLVQQILAFSRQSEMERIPLHPANVVEEAIKMLRPSLPTTIEIKQIIESTTGLILADPTQRILQC